ncbi:glycosyltransferase [Candidatus Omnitrophota bacterium]
MNRDIVIFLSVEWQEFFKRHLISALAKEVLGRSRILCVNRPVCPFVSPLTERKKMFSWISDLASGSGCVKRESENLFVYTPFSLLHHRIAKHIPLAAAANRRILRAQVMRTLKTLSFDEKRLAVIIYNHFQKDHVGLLDEQLLIYDCYDEYASFVGRQYPENMRDRIRDDEKDILGKADVVVTVSQLLADEKSKYNMNVHCIPNAVDMKFFRKVYGERPAMPSEMERFRRPIIGLSGDLTSRIDYGMVGSVASRHPEWSFVFVGTIHGKESFLRYDDFLGVKKLPNVFFLGRRPYEEFPNYIRAFDVCIIPFAETLFNRSSSPLRLYDYLASGRPVVSTDIPEARKFSDLVSIAHTADEFAAKIDSILKNGRSNDIAERQMGIADENTWEERAARYAHAIDDAFRQKVA